MWQKSVGDQMGLALLLVARQVDAVREHHLAKERHAT